MRMSVICRAFAILLVSGCTHAGPEERTEATAVQAGQSIAVDEGNHGAQGARITIPEDGVVFVHSTRFPGRPDVTDLSGVSIIYIFVPDDLVTALKRDGAVEAANENGLQAFAYSRNDADPEGTCFQRLSEGKVSMRIENPPEIVVESELRTPPMAAPSDARCDVSEFVNTSTFNTRSN